MLYKGTTQCLGFTNAYWGINQ